MHLIKTDIYIRGNELCVLRQAWLVSRRDINKKKLCFLHFEQQGKVKCECHASTQNINKQLL